MWNKGYCIIYYYNHRYISIIPENRGKHGENEKLALNSNSACSNASSGGNMYSWTYTCHENTSIYGNNTCSEHALGDMLASKTSISLNDSNNDLNNDLNINLINFNNNNSFASNLDTTIDNCMPDILHAYTGESPSSSSYDLDYDVENTMFNRLSEIRSHNTNKIIIAELNINSIRNKFEQLVENIDKNVDILLIVETKLDDSFPIKQFYIEGSQQFRLDRSSHGGGLILYVRDNIPIKQLKQFCIHDDVEAIAIEINLWKRKWFICGSYNPQENKIIHHLDHVGKLIDFYLSMYENIILLGDYNCEEKHSAMEEFLHTFNLKNLVKKPMCYKSVNNPCTIDLILTNKSKSFFKNDVIEAGLLDFH